MYDNNCQAVERIDGAGKQPAEEKPVKAGIDWFLFRWLMARNIDTFFCLIVIVVYVIGLFV